MNLSKTESQAEVTSRRTMPHNSNNLEMLRGNTDEEGKYKYINHADILNFRIIQNNW